MKIYYHGWACLHPNIEIKSNTYWGSGYVFI